VHEVATVENCTKMKTISLQKAEGMNSKIEERKHKRKVKSKFTNIFLEDSEEGEV
jgi:hypothetical protein